MNRRTYLAGMTATVTGMSGCATVGFGSDQSGDVRLRQLEVLNRSEERHAVHLLVFYDGNLKGWTSIEAEPFDDETERAGGGVVNRTWPNEPGTVVVYARLDGDERWEKLHLSDAVETDCAEAFATIDDRGLTLWHSDGCHDGTESSSVATRLLRSSHRRA